MPTTKSCHHPTSRHRISMNTCSKKTFDIRISSYFNVHFFLNQCACHRAVIVFVFDAMQPSTTSVAHMPSTVIIGRSNRGFEQEKAPVCWVQPMGRNAHCSSKFCPAHGWPTGQDLPLSNCRPPSQPICSKPIKTRALLGLQ